jgi:uroporphyrinogen-III synthase
VAIPSHGSLDRVVDVLERDGAICWRCPLVAMTGPSDEQAVHRWLQALVAGQLDDVIFLSAEGTQHLLAVASDKGMTEAVVAALSRVRRIARGTRTGYFLQMISLAPQVCSPAATSRNLIEHLRDLDLAGRNVGVQLAGQDPARELLSFLSARDGRAFPVAADGCTTAGDETALLEFIDDAARGELDAFVFTSSAQVAHLGTLAAQRDRAAVLRAALDAMTVAGVGASTVAGLTTLGVRRVIELDRRFFIRRLTEALAAARQRPGLCKPGLQSATSVA